MIQSLAWYARTARNNPMRSVPSDMKAPYVEPTLTQHKPLRDIAAHNQSDLG